MPLTRVLVPCLSPERLRVDLERLLGRESVRVPRVEWRVVCPHVWLLGVVGCWVVHWVERGWLVSWNTAQDFSEFGQGVDRLSVETLFGWAVIEVKQVR